MEQWSTNEELAAARDRFAVAIPGWKQPVAHGVGLIPSGADPSPEHFPIPNAGEHMLVAVAAATALGYSSGTRVIEVDRADLERAIELLSPAEAAQMPHPNLWLWRDTYLPALDADPEARVVAVFIGDLDDPISGPADAAFREALSFRSS